MLIAPYFFQISMAYRSTLLATLIPVTYEKTIDTIDDLDQSGLPIMLPMGNAYYQNFRRDPRQAMQSIFQRSAEWHYDSSKPKPDYYYPM